MSDLFENFNAISEKEWKNKVQVELKGQEYNQTLVWGTSDQINVKPVYTKDSIDYSAIQPLPRQANDWKIISKYTGNPQQDHSFLYGYTIDQSQLDQASFPEYLDLFVKFESIEGLAQLDQLPNLTYLDLDILGYYAQNGWWMNDTKEASLALVEKALALNHVQKVIAVQADVYQNAGATHVQQLAIALAHGVEYIELFGPAIAERLYFKFAVGHNYFFEIAKLRAFRFLWKLILEAYQTESDAFIYTTTSLRNKSTLDKYNNVIRSTIEASAAVLGGSDAVSVTTYDELNAASDFGLELAAKQQLLLQREANLGQFNDPVAGAYYVESLTNQMAEHALELFKTFQNTGGFIACLENETIQDFVYTAARKEQKDFDEGILQLIGVNKFKNPTDKVEQTPVKRHIQHALFLPIAPTRLSEKEEKQTN